MLGVGEDSSVCMGSEGLFIEAWEVGHVGAQAAGSEKEGPGGARW